MAEMCVGSIFHWSVESRTCFEDARRDAFVRRAERRRVISMSSEGVGLF